MNDDGYRDYRDLSPNSDEEGFQIDTKGLIDRIRQIPAPTEFQKGTRTAINEEIQRLGKVLKHMSPEAKEELKIREVDYIKNGWMKRVVHIEEDTLVDQDILDRYVTRVYLDIDSSIGRLMKFTQWPYQGRREDPRQRQLMREAKKLWREFGGEITISEQKPGGFYDYVEGLVEDTGLKITARTLLRNYA